MRASLAARLVARRTPGARATAALLLLTACGGSIYNTSPVGLSPTTPLLDPDQPRADKPDVSITPAGVVPQVLHVNAPVTVTFTNDDTVAHTLRTADLGFDQCPEMNGFGTLLPGQSGSVGFSESDAVCTYSEVAQPANKAFQGYVAIHPAK
jgi:plastocyanin